MDIFKLLGILGVICIAIGIVLRKRKIEDLFYIIGGVLLEAYSIHIGDRIFMVLQVIFTLTAVYDFVRVTVFKKSKRG